MAPSSPGPLRPPARKRPFPSQPLSPSAHRGFGVLHGDPLSLPHAQGARGGMLWVPVLSQLILILLCGTWVSSCGSPPEFLGWRRGQGTKGTSFDTTRAWEVVWGAHRDAALGFFPPLEAPNVRPAIFLVEKGYFSPGFWCL